LLTRKKIGHLKSERSATHEFAVLTLTVPGLRAKKFQNPKVLSRICAIFILLNWGTLNMC